MSKRSDRPGRRAFLQGIAGSAAVATQAGAHPATPTRTTPASTAIAYPRVFTGAHTKMIAFPLGGVAAGSVSLGGRGQLRDWEICNRADKGHHLAYALPSIWVEARGAKPVARVLEAEYQPPYAGQDGLGSQNAPGLSRLRTARFTGEYPLARVDFEDAALPVTVSLEAFSPFIPHEPDESGLPVAILRYTVRNPRRTAKVAIAWSIDNPVGAGEKRVNEYRESPPLRGLSMKNPALPADDVLNGSFALCVADGASSGLTHLRGWPRGRWWNSPMLFWDDFSADGALGPEAEQMNSVGSLCLSHEIPAGGHAQYTFVLAWHFPNRTPARCGWKAPHGEENTVIGNWYATRFKDAWDAAEYATANLARLERKTRQFAGAFRESTVPAVIKEAASANLSTLASTTCFRTADGEFHGFEGVDDHLGCCFGNCTHVWNYETATAHLFPSFARSLRKAAFGFSMDDAGAMHFRQLLPDGKERSGFAASDGQMGQIVHAYLDWTLSGDSAWLAEMWPRVRKAVEFAWVPGGWDADRDGVMEGVQHNTYDVEFYGPNPLCGVYYLAALRAAEEMARAVGDSDFAGECRRLFDNGSRWIDANLFNAEYYIQQVKPRAPGEIAPSLRSEMGASDPEHPEYQLGAGCLVDQLLGQYLAEVCGLGPLLDAAHVRTTLHSVHRYNYKRSLAAHDCVQRTFALNDEAATLVCDYAKAPRPRIPFPYYAEVFTGLEHATAAHMLYAGMLEEGLQAIASTRARYDGERRNPWDEAECGHHYARAMAAWSSFLALSGFHYNGATQHAALLPRVRAAKFRCFWSTGTGWGVFTAASLKVLHGTLPLASYEVQRGKTVRLRKPVVLREGASLDLARRA